MHSFPPSRRWLLLALAALALAGCQGPTPPDAREPPATDAPTQEGGLVELYRQEDDDSRVVAVNTCTEPEPAPSPFERNAALVPAGTDHLELTVGNEDLAPSYQVGASLDGGPVTWLDPVAGGTRVFAIAVTAEQVESEATGQRWQFVRRYAAGAMGLDCYNGPVFDDHSVLIAAVPSPS
jgi:hypothetical protein